MTQYDCIPAILIPVGAGVVVRPLYTNLPQIKTAVAVIPNLKGISYLMKCPLNSTAFVDISRKTLEMFRNYSVLLELPIIPGQPSARFSGKNSCRRKTGRPPHNEAGGPMRPGTIPATVKLSPGPAATSRNDCNSSNGCQLKPWRIRPDYSSSARFFAISSSESA